MLTLKQMQSKNAAMWTMGQKPQNNFVNSFHKLTMVL